MKLHSRKKALAIIVLIIAALLISGSLARGWIRGSLIPAYVTTFYKHSVDSNFNNDFTPVNKLLEPYGFTAWSVTRDDCSKGADAQYSRFSESINCDKDQGSNSINPSTAYITKWQQSSNNIESYLYAHGWQKIYYAKQSISGLFSVKGYDGSVGVNYAKSHGKLECDLSISYNPPGTTYDINTLKILPGQLFVEESCTRIVAFFGGYGY